MCVSLTDNYAVDHCYREWAIFCIHIPHLLMILSTTSIDHCACIQVDKESQDRLCEECLRMHPDEVQLKGVLKLVSTSVSFWASTGPRWNCLLTWSWRGIQSHLINGVAFFQLALWKKHGSGCCWGERSWPSAPYLAAALLNCQIKLS